MPIGYLTTVAVVTAGTVLALRPLRRSGRLGTFSWLLSSAVNESPFVAAYWVLAATALAFAQGDLNPPAAAIATGLSLLSLAAAPVLVRRALRTGTVVDDALDEGLGPGWRHAVGQARPDPGQRRRLPWFRILFAPLPLSRRGVRRTRNVSYGPHGRRNRLDIYRGAGQAPGAPILIHLHGGGFRSGRRSFYARAMLHQFASRGWVCISASYRLRPAEFLDFVVDVKRVIAWAREHAPEQEADPGCVVLAGSSAGAHLAITATLTPNDPRFQPGFEEADTSVAAGIGLYGYYGPIEPGPEPSSPADFVHPGAPPIMVAHGEQDTFVPPAIARRLVSRARAVSTSPVVYAELPGAQHSFDLFHSIRFARLIVGLEDFLGWIRSTASTREAPRSETG